MKRYKVCGPISELSGFTKLALCYMHENSNGDWVKWEDVKEFEFIKERPLSKVVLEKENSIDAYKFYNQLKDQARSAGVGSGAVDRLEWKAAKLESDSAECICATMVNQHKAYPRSNADVINQLLNERGTDAIWICPAHGYKKL